MSDIAIVFVLALLFGFLLGNLFACERGGCFAHGKDYKTRAERGDSK